jgi:hypothetical protein
MLGAKCKDENHTCHGQEKDIKRKLRWNEKI